MSYRELQSLSERLCILRYPQSVPLDAFRDTENFAQLAPLLLWLLRAFHDPENSAPSSFGTAQFPVLPANLDSAEARASFVDSAVAFASLTANVKLSAKRLLTASAPAVREILRLADILCNAQRLTDPPQSLQNANNAVAQQDAKRENQSLLAIARAARELSLGVTARGAKLYAGVGSEAKRRATRSRSAAAVSATLDVAGAEAAVARSHAGILAQTNAAKEAAARAENDAATAVAACERRRAELARREKRLRCLRNVRPSYMDDFERYESELRVLFSLYVDKMRNISFLEQLADDRARAEDGANEAAAESLRRMQQAIKDEEAEIMRGDTHNILEIDSDLIHDDNDDNDDDDDDDDEKFDGYAEEEYAANKGAPRPKGEDPEAKRQRKREVKAERKQKRAERKELKIAFSEEKKKQIKKIMQLKESVGPNAFA